MPFTASPPSHEAAEPIRQRQRTNVAEQPERGRDGHRGASCEGTATPADVPDRDLLTRFLKQQDEAAFRTLMERHSRLVLGVALRTLHDRHAAEDVLQATFLVFAQKARGIRRRGAVSSWLHGVACRISLRMLASRKRRAEEALAGDPMHTVSTLDDVGAHWEQQVLDEELQQLPLGTREPLILHELEGQSCAEIAAAMGLSVSAVEGRLKRGRKELKQRLLRRGVGISGALLAVQTLQAKSAAAAPALINETLHAALALSAGNMAQLEPTEAVRLAQQEMLVMTGAKTTTLLLTAGGLTLSSGLLGMALLAAGSPGSATSGLAGGTVVAAFDPGASDGEANSENAAAAGDATFEANPAAEKNPTTSLDYKSASRQRAEIEEALTMPTDLEFIDTELGQAVQYLSDRYQIPILPDEAAMSEVGVGLDTQINLVISGIPFSSALNLILKPHDLDYVIEDDVLKITTKEEAAKVMETRVYDLRGLPADFKPEDIARVVIRNIAPASWGTNAWVYVQPTPAPAASMYGSEGYADPGADGYGAGAMGGMESGQQKPVSATEPTAAIETLPGLLVITQTQHRHREITDLLQQLHRVPERSAPLNPLSSSPYPPESP